MGNGQPVSYGRVVRLPLVPLLVVAAFAASSCTSLPDRFASPEDEAVLALAGRGDVEAQAALGAMFEDGRGGAPDYDRAVSWYRLAADGGDAFAAYRLGLLYEKGLGVRRDVDEAANLYRRAAAAGSEPAAFRLGQLYEQGALGIRDVAEALRWYRMAAAGWRARSHYPLLPDFALADAAPPTPRATGIEIHLASVPDEAEAEAAWTALQNAYPDVLGGLALEVAPLDLGDAGVYYQVRAGPFADVDAARAACRALHARGRFCQPVP